MFFFNAIHTSLGWQLKEKFRCIYFLYFDNDMWRSVVCFSYSRFARLPASFATATIKNVFPLFSYHFFSVFSLKNFFLAGTFCIYILRSSDPTLVGVLYLIVAFWNASAAYQASLVEPGTVRILARRKYPWRDQTSLICRRSVPKRYD